MSHTALSFYRKPQTIHQLQTERPKSLSSLHSAISHGVSDIFSRVENIERDYYGGKKAEVDIHQMVPQFRDVMKNLQISHIHAQWQVDDILHRKDIFTEGIYRGDISSIDTIRKFDERLKTFVPNMFQEIKGILWAIIGNLEKYCMSFFKGKQDVYLETAYSYENKRKELIASIRNSIERITNVADTYRQGGLTLKMLGMYANDLARKCDCYEAPVLFIFPDVCQSVRNACADINRWVELDSQYATFVMNDIQELQQKREGHFRRVRDMREKLCQLDQKIKNNKKDIDELSKQFVQFKTRERDIREGIMTLKTEVMDLETHLETRERERDSLKAVSRSGSSRKGSARSSCAETEALEVLAMEISKLRINLSMTRRQIESNNSKLKLIDKKKQTLNQKNSALIKLEKLKSIQKTELVLAEHELTRIESCVGQLKDIHTLRVSTDITKKIFHNIPIASPRSAASSTGKSTKPLSQLNRVDSLTRWSKMVSQHIGPDWTKLYRSLPFVPERGDVARDEDIGKIISSQWRSTQDMQALESFKRWRRFHPQANVDELKKHLLLINRKDVIEKVEDMIRPRPPPRSTGRGWQKVKKISHGVHAMFVMRSPSPPDRPPPRLLVF